MGDIKYLPEAVRSSVRSGIIIFDLNRVVEELIFNSLDAGATKISVTVDAGTCYVKVVDNGCGITRDGLMLLGERYATSKIDQLADMNSVIGSFGFRGEALSSISDVSLLEVITKAHGRPNGYRKVMKGCKCLYLGIDDGRQDVGTTVIVRDLFYNQPVRRKQIQSSTKKVLQSVKKCVLRIALVHPRVLFKVVDINSDDELLCTTPSSSPLSLLMTGFGIEVSSSLHELNVSDGILKLSGYMHISRGTCSVKAFQYVYINSRHTCKGPIHKLLNQLATSFNSLDLQNANIGSKNAKRSRSQTYATYILNISCPRSWYDLTFEPSKTSVEFKDWFPIISFIEKAITQFWGEKFSYGGPLSHGTDMSGQDMQRVADSTLSPEKDLLAIEKRCRIHNHPPFGLPSPWLEMQTEESDLMSYQKDNRVFCCNALEFKDQQTGLGFVDPTEYSFHGLSAPSRVSVNQENGSYLPGPHSNIFSAEDRFLGNKFAQTENFDEHADCILGSCFEDEHLHKDAKINSSYTGSALSSDCFKISDDVDKVSTDFKKPFLHSCSSWRSLSLDGESLSSSEEFDFQTLGVRTKRKRLEPDDWVDVGEVDDSDQRTFDFRGRSLWQDDATSMWSPPGPITKCDVCASLKFFSRDSVKKSAFGGECLDCKNEPPLDSVGPIRQFGSSTHWSFDSEWPSVMSDPVFGAKCHGEEQFVDKNAHERCIKYDISDGYDYLADRVIKDRAFHFDDVLQNGSSRENCFLSSRTNVCADFKCYDSRSKEDNCGFLKKHNPDNELFPKHSDIFSDETDLLCLESGGKYNSHYGAVTSCRISSSIYSDKHENQKDQILYQEEENVCKRRPRRSHSAPPFYRGKKKFFALNNRLTTDTGKPKIYTNDDAHISQETSEWKQSQKRSSGVCQLHSESNSVEDPLIYTRSDEKKAPDAFDIQKLKKQKKSEATCIYDMHLAKDVEDPLASGIKWQKSFPKTANGETLRHCHSEDTILDISSGILHLAGDSLIPESVNKNCLEDARVLQQVDKKFIPVVGCGILALIDQHAADERIRLEELRQKVLSGEKKTITYLDTEQKLVLPEVGYQLLHNYGEQIQNWGWLCNIHAPGSMSFRKNLNLLHKQQTAVTLLAVPCILGVNLTDGDLLEFLQQLADTDGSSTIPPSVHRVLNSKACRGAIMFGDTLLPSECSLIVEELKQTSLCFQCAHGRPTTVPLVNLEALHKQITKLGTWNDGSSDLWHGLSRHELSLERAAQRLTASRG